MMVNPMGSFVGPVGFSSVAWLRKIASVARVSELRADFLGEVRGRGVDAAAFSCGIVTRGVGGGVEITVPLAADLESVIRWAISYANSTPSFRGANHSICYSDTHLVYRSLSVCVIDVVRAVVLRFMSTHLWKDEFIYNTPLCRHIEKTVRLRDPDSQDMNERKWGRPGHLVSAYYDECGIFRRTALNADGSRDLILMEEKVVSAVADLGVLSTILDAVETLIPPPRPWKVVWQEALDDVRGDEDLPTPPAPPQEGTRASFGTAAGTVRRSSSNPARNRRVRIPMEETERRVAKVAEGLSDVQDAFERVEATHQWWQRNPLFVAQAARRGLVASGVYVGSAANLVWSALSAVHSDGFITMTACAALSKALKFGTNEAAALGNFLMAGRGGLDYTMRLVVELLAAVMGYSVILPASHVSWTTCILTLLRCAVASLDTVDKVMKGLLDFTLRRVAKYVSGVTITLVESVNASLTVVGILYRRLMGRYSIDAMRVTQDAASDFLKFVQLGPETKSLMLTNLAAVGVPVSGDGVTPCPPEYMRDQNGPILDANGDAVLASHAIPKVVEVASLALVAGLAIRSRIAACRSVQQELVPVVDAADAQVVRTTLGLDTVEVGVGSTQRDAAEIIRSAIKEDVETSVQPEVTRPLRLADALRYIRGFAPRFHWKFLGKFRAVDPVPSPAVVQEASASQENGKGKNRGAKSRIRYLRHVTGRNDLSYDRATEEGRTAQEEDWELRDRDEEEYLEKARDDWAHGDGRALDDANDFVRRVRGQTRGYVRGQSSQECNGYNPLSVYKCVDQEAYVAGSKPVNVELVGSVIAPGANGFPVHRTSCVRTRDHLLFSLDHFVASAIVDEEDGSQRLMTFPELEKVLAAFLADNTVTLVRHCKTPLVVRILPGQYRLWACRTEQGAWYGCVAVATSACGATALKLDSFNVGVTWSSGAMSRLVLDKTPDGKFMALIHFHNTQGTSVVPFDSCRRIPGITKPTMVPHNANSHRGVCGSAIVSGGVVVGVHVAGGLDANYFFALPSPSFSGESYLVDTDLVGPPSGMSEIKNSTSGQKVSSRWSSDYLMSSLGCARVTNPISLNPLEPCASAPTPESFQERSTGSGSKPAPAQQPLPSPTSETTLKGSTTSALLAPKPVESGSTTSTIPAPLPVLVPRSSEPLNAQSKRSQNRLQSSQHLVKKFSEALAAGNTLTKEELEKLSSANEFLRKLRASEGITPVPPSGKQA